MRILHTLQCAPSTRVDPCCCVVCAISSGLVQGWTWIAYPLASQWTRRGWSNREFFQNEDGGDRNWCRARRRSAVVLSSAVTGSTQSIDVNIQPSTAWPGTTWSSNFYVKYTSQVAIGVAGTYTFFLTFSVGSNAATCSVNGGTVVSTPTYGDSWSNVAQLTCGAVVRLPRSAYARCGGSE